MKKQIAALIIAAGMMITPCTSKAYTYYDVTQWLLVQSNTWNFIAYQYAGFSWNSTDWAFGNWWFDFWLSNTNINLWVYDWSTGTYRDNTYVYNQYEG